MEVNSLRWLKPTGYTTFPLQGMGVKQVGGIDSLVFKIKGTFTPSLNPGPLGLLKAIVEIVVCTDILWMSEIPNS
jgi:hypothetical protein